MTAVEFLLEKWSIQGTLYSSDIEQAKEMDKEQENKLISKIFQIQNLPPHIDESGADGTQGWDGIPDKETEQEEKLWTNEEVFDMLYKTDKFLMVELREYWKTIKKH
jgi:hypothetical protein